MKKISYITALIIASYYLLLIFRFCHPYPKSEYYNVLGIQFLVVFIAYLTKERYGRIMTVIAGFSLVRIGPILQISSLITITGVFFGASCGILFRELVLYFSLKKDRELEKHSSSFLNPFLILIFFLYLLTLERFMIYFGSPFLNGFGILETLYLKILSSKLAYSLSMETITNLFFPILYLFLEFTRNEKNKVIQDLKDGVKIVIALQFLIMTLQIVWNRNFLADNTNLSLEANRVMGLFRDSGSSTWILPIICFLFYKDFLEKKKYIFFTLILVFQVYIASFQGRGFWLLFFLGFILQFLQYFKNVSIDSKKNFFYVFSISLLTIGFIALIPKDKNGTLYRLLSIPNHFLEMVLSGKNPFLEFDPHRYYFNLAAWNLFQSHPLFGTGIGSYIVNLKDSSLGLYIPENKIDNPSFYLGILSELGIFGLILIILPFWERILNKENISILILLSVGLSFGYHIVQPDSAFALLLILIIGCKENSTELNHNFKIISMTILLSLYILYLSFQILSQDKMPEFRKFATGQFQLLAYELNKETENKKYHVFKGKTIWSIAKGIGGIEIDPFLDNSTSKKTLKQRWSILDAKRNSLASFELTLEKEKEVLKLIRIPDNAYYLQVEELDEKGKVQLYGDIPFCIPIIHFSEMNEFL
ncbi:MAG TPA: O-antigen ligase family protein [Leptospiraceae bacterium]|nr:O-antigen ligase family protein [Leptospiraceae bacterium]HMW03700.1 O-antigen ligase family protein [Leptospiraceae bacterium]HMX35382.1 O-antigen ligase family protein [Leptospiraceae bacterium]HMY29680.1 O-antigen ligase family protein [Leptospiraceae bacterium]HMZ64044.1 O-antigen ligase family protein [Leptospiraceae bacterium]